MNPKLISVIVPCFNQEDMILQTLESISSQTYSNWECIIVNDGSTDNSQKKIQDFIQNDSRFKLINIKNSGVSIARNTAVANSNGVYLFPLDGDDYIDKDCLEKCLVGFEKNLNVKLAYTDSEFFGKEAGPWNLPDFDYPTMLKYNMVHNSSMFFREDFDRVGGYRTNMVHGLEDWDFFIALLEPYTNAQVIKIKEPLFHYRVTEKSRRNTLITTSKFNLMLDNIVYNNFRIYQKYYPNIFERIQKYDYHHVMMNKTLIKMATSLYNQLHKIKNRINKKSRNAE